MAFFLWRSYIAYKLKLINQEKFGSGHRNVKSGLRDFEDNSPKNNSKSVRSIRSGNTSGSINYPVRMFN